MKAHLEIVFYISEVIVAEGIPMMRNGGEAQISNNTDINLIVSIPIIFFKFVNASQISAQLWNQYFHQPQYA